MSRTNTVQRRPHPGHERPRTSGFYEEICYKRPYVQNYEDRTHVFDIGMAPAASKGGHLIDIEKMVKAVKLCGSTPKVDQCKQCAYWAGGDMSKCIPRMTLEAATALSTLQAENEKLRSELSICKEKNAGLALALLTECAPNPDCLGDDEWRAIRAELEQVKAERDTAVEYLRGQCRYCKRNLVCTSRKGPPSNCWEWRGQKED